MLNTATISPGTGDILLTDVMCTGAEDTLMSCMKSVNTSACQRTQDAGARCAGIAMISVLARVLILLFCG